MKTIFKYGLALGMLSATTVAQAAPSWSGKYEYGEDGGSTAGGTRIFITHDLHIWKGKNGFEARVESNGYQTYNDFICTAKASGNKLNIYFVKATMKEMYFGGKKGDLMFSLERTKTHGPRGLITVWNKYAPFTMEKYPARMVAFIPKTNNR